MAETDADTPSPREQAIAAICRELTSARVVRAKSAAAAALAARFPQAATDAAAWQTYEARPGETTTVRVDYGAAPDGTAGITAAATIGSLADAVLDALGDTAADASFPFGFTA